MSAAVGGAGAAGAASGGAAADAVFRAVQNGNLDQFREALRHMDAATLNTITGMAFRDAPWLRKEDRRHVHLITAVIARGKIEMLEEILKVAGVNVNGSDNGMTFLEHALREARSPMAVALLAAGAKPTQNLLFRAIAIHNPSGVKALLDAGLSANDPSQVDEWDDRDRSTPLIASLMRSGKEQQQQPQIVAHLIGSGADVNRVGPDGFSPLLTALMVDGPNPAIIANLIAAGADVNYMHPASGVTALHYAASKGSLAILSALIGSGADVNAVETHYGGTPLFYAASKGHTAIVAALLAAGADVTKIITHEGRSVKQMAAAGAFTPEINDLLSPPAPPEPWKGLTRKDVEKLDTIFDTETPGGNSSKRPPAENWSFCPVCLGYAERESGCKYMTHDCRNHDWFHRTLYERYHDGFGRISWCTVCGRVCSGHVHFKRHPAAVTGPSLVEVPPGTTTATFFTSDCRAEGGGGLDEKLLRFRQFKETALRLNGERDNPSMTRQLALQQLVEETWDAPVYSREMYGPEKLAKMRADKAFNVATANFPEESAAATNAAAAAAEAAAGPLLNHRRPAADSLKPFVAPVGTALTGAAGAASAVAENAIGAANTGDVIFFRHMQLDGTPRDHRERAEGIGKDALNLYVTESIKTFGVDPHFGKCPFHSADCGALLFPDEIADFVPKELADRYFEAFNRVYEKRKKASVAGYTVPGTPVAVAATGGAGTGSMGGGSRGRRLTRKRKNH